MLTRTNRTLSANLDRLNLGTRSLVVIGTTGLVNVVALRAFETHPRVMRSHAMRPDGAISAAKRPWSIPGSSFAAIFTPSCRATGLSYQGRPAASGTGVARTRAVVVPAVSAPSGPVPARPTRPATRPYHHTAAPAAARG
jgi:hypothetical protein